jgi:hypothetical protein
MTRAEFEATPYRDEVEHYEVGKWYRVRGAARTIVKYCGMAANGPWFDAWGCDVRD